MSISKYTTTISTIDCKMNTIIYLGANLNESDADGLTALHHAASNGHLYAVQLLLELGANPELATK